MRKTARKAAAKPVKGTSKRQQNSSRWERIDPATARVYLEKIHAGNRADEASVNAYATAMSNDMWLPNAMPILFSPDGTLLDGEKRLRACIKANKPFTSWVKRGVPADILHTVDQHRRRSYQGVLESRGEKNAGTLIRLIAKLIRIDRGVLGFDNSAIPWLQMDRVLDENPLIREAVDLSLRHASIPLQGTARHVLVYMAIASGQRATLKDFLLAMSDLDAYPKDHPAAALGAQLELYRKAVGKAMDVDEQLALGVIAFEALRKKEKAPRAGYSWKPKYGKAALNDAGKPISRKEAKEKSPPNFGLPLLSGYPKLEGMSATDETGQLAGPLAESLRSVSKSEGLPEVQEGVVVTPDLARDWLARFNRSNRKIMRKHVVTIARDIKNGHWQYNAQPICFSDNGRLLNGQHRLSAVVEADTDIVVDIARNVPDAAFATYDIQLKKSVVPMGLEKVDPRVLQAAAKIQWRVDTGAAPGATAYKPTSTEMMLTLERHPGLADGFAQARRMLDIGSAAVITFLIYHTKRDRPDLSERFINALETGEGLFRPNPLLRIRNALLSQRGSDNRKDRLLMLLQAWEQYKQYSDQEASLLN
jgi:hypothetical protein